MPYFAMSHKSCFSKDKGCKIKLVDRVFIHLDSCVKPCNEA